MFDGVTIEVVCNKGDSH